MPINNEVCFVSLIMFHVEHKVHPDFLAAWRRFALAAMVLESVAFLEPQPFSGVNSDGSCRRVGTNSSLEQPPKQLNCQPKDPRAKCASNLGKVWLPAELDETRMTRDRVLRLPLWFSRRVENVVQVQLSQSRKRCPGEVVKGKNTLFCFESFLLCAACCCC
jgi:hypothetical protein